MALCENKVTLKGYLGKNVQTYATRQQNTFVVLSLATKSGYKDKHTGKWINHTEWHRIVAFGKAADYARNLRKGDYLEVEGQLRSTEFGAQASEGKKKTASKYRVWEIRASIIKRLAPLTAKAEQDDRAPITEEDAA